MVNGLRHFVRSFGELADCFILIGGTACELWMNSQGLEFRATKDLDVVLVADKLSADFTSRFWGFIAEGRYASHERSQPRPNCYRFKGPADERHPFMIELFTQNFLSVPDQVHLTPIPAGEDISSLSAILLSDEYYELIVRSRTVVDGVPTVPAGCLIPLKARAFLDLAARQAQGLPADSKDLKKHRTDVFKLFMTLAPTDRVSLAPPVAQDLSRFLDRFSANSPEWKGIRAAVTDLPPPDVVANRLRIIFGLD
jgi:hypothetical protein